MSMFRYLAEITVVQQHAAVTGDQEGEWLHILPSIMLVWGSGDNVPCCCGTDRLSSFTMLEMGSGDRYTSAYLGTSLSPFPGVAAQSVARGHQPIQHGVIMLEDWRLLRYSAHLVTWEPSGCWAWTLTSPSSPALGTADRCMLASLTPRHLTTVCPYQDPA